MFCLGIIFIKKDHYSKQLNTKRVQQTGETIRAQLDITSSTGQTRHLHQRRIFIFFYERKFRL